MMATLAKRANKRQRKILRAIAWAVHNAAHVHPENAPKELDRFARSVAKRATGTISALMPELLAADENRYPSSESGDRQVANDFHGTKRSSAKPRRATGSADSYDQRSPLSTLHRKITKMITPARLSGNVAMASALQQAAEIIGREIKRSERKMTENVTCQKADTG